MFQFPSNGKDFPNCSVSSSGSVSSGVFQFPSNGKDFPNSLATMCGSSPRTMSFNSLQTGRTFRTNRDAHYIRNQPLCFNSLQTGRTFRTGARKTKELGIYLFQFPSNGKDFPNINVNAESESKYHGGFNSLQTGRTFRTFAIETKQTQVTQVSIPFKREGLSELARN